MLPVLEYKYAINYGFWKRGYPNNVQQHALIRCWAVRKKTFDPRRAMTICLRGHYHHTEVRCSYMARRLTCEWYRYTDIPLL